MEYEAVMTKILREAERDQETWDLISPKVIECRCGDELELWDSWENSCTKCWASYNSAGQELAPRELWGEETGEDFRGPSDYSEELDW